MSSEEPPIVRLMAASCAFSLAIIKRTKLHDIPPIFSVELSTPLYQAFLRNVGRAQSIPFNVRHLKHYFD